MRIASVGTALPTHRFSQSEISTMLVERWQERLPEPRMLTRLHANCGVDTRHFLLPLDEYPALRGFGPTNNAWIEGAVALGELAVTRALDQAGLTAADISSIFFTSVTGISSPTIDARLINRLPFPDSIKRTPVFGLGCVAGAAGVSRVTDYVRAYPDQYALLLSVEICSLTWQDHDLSVANLISCGLFGDGAAAVIIAGEQAAARLPVAMRGPKVIATRSIFYRDTEYIMGWDIGDSGFTIVLSPEVPRVVFEHLRGDIDRFLAANGLELKDVASWLFHSGGPKVLEALEAALQLAPGALEISWRSLREVGNLSAASVLMVLAERLAESPGEPGTYSILAAMGPGFCSELVLLQW